MRNINLNYTNEAILAETEISDMEKFLEKESIFEQQEEQEEYSGMNIVCWTFEDGYVAGRDQELRTPEQFRKFFEGNERVLTSSNVNGFNIFVATTRSDLYALGYVIMDTKEFMEENPDGLYDTWIELLDELKS